MITNGFSNTERPFPGPHRFHRYVVLLLITLSVALFMSMAAPATPDDQEDRGTAQVAVVADLLSDAPDQVSIHLLDKSDKALLTKIANALGEKVHAKPDRIEFKQADPDFVKNSKDIGIEFRLPIVPRGERYLPVAPFIETFAPYVSTLQIVYVIQGPFTYQGYQSYQHRDVSFTVDPPTSLQKLGNPIAFYGVNANIKNPSLDSLPLQPYPETDAKQKRLALYLKVALTGLIGACIGLILSLILSRWKKSVVAQKGDD